MTETATVRLATTPDNRVTATVILPANLETLSIDERRRAVEDAAARVVDGSLARLDRIAHPTRQFARAG